MLAIHHHWDCLAFELHSEGGLTWGVRFYLVATKSGTYSQMDDKSKEMENEFKMFLSHSTCSVES